jgi:formylglycine-generating enzyme required for sulfatase activity
MPNSDLNSLAFYCAGHQIRFQAAGAAVIKCDQGGHAIGYGFPHESFWTYCCDCATFWPYESVDAGLQRSECLVCERQIAKRYLCNSCLVMSIESSALVRRKVHSIETSGGVKPNCPGCKSAPPARSLKHNCPEAGISFLTARSTCLLCQLQLVDSGAETPESSQRRFCGACGTDLTAPFKFCKRCGKAQTVTSAEATTNSRVTLHGTANEQRVPQQEEAAQCDREQQVIDNQRLPKRDEQQPIEQANSQSATEDFTLPTPPIFTNEDPVAESGGTESDELETLDPIISPLEPLSVEQRGTDSLSAVGPVLDLAQSLQSKRTEVTSAKPEPADLAEVSPYVPSWDSTHSNVPTKRRTPWLIGLGAVLLSLSILIAVVWLISGRQQATKIVPPVPQVPLSPPGMVYLPGGEFIMGSDKGDEYERPAHKVTVKPFYIDITEVTCEDYQRFITATGHKLPPKWANGTYPLGDAKRPVTGVDWNDAEAYARWAKKRLPTEEEWEFVARGTDGRTYPWGYDWRPKLANAGDSSAHGLANVGSYPDGKTSTGVMDLIGNAWEWTSSDVGAYPGGRLSAPPLSDVKIIRGGSWQESNKQATNTYRGFLRISGAKDYSATSFRCVTEGGSNPVSSK